MYFVRFHPEVTSCLLSRGKTKYATLGMRLWCKYIRNYLLVYQLDFTFSAISPKLQGVWRWNFRFAVRKIWAFIWNQKYTTSVWARGDENVIGIRAFKKEKKESYISPLNCNVCARWWSGMCAVLATPIKCAVFVPSWVSIHGSLLDSALAVWCWSLHWHWQYQEHAVTLVCLCSFLPVPSTECTVIIMMIKNTANLATFIWFDLPGRLDYHCSAT